MDTYGNFIDSSWNNSEAVEPREFLDTTELLVRPGPLVSNGASSSPPGNGPDRLNHASVSGGATGVFCVDPEDDTSSGRRKRKAQTLREEHWRPVKQRIIELYDDHQLSDIMTKLKDQYGFTAT